ELRRVGERLGASRRGLGILVHPLGDRIATLLAGAAEPVAHGALFAQRLRAAAVPSVAASLVGLTPLTRAHAVLDRRLAGARPPCGGGGQARERAGALLSHVIGARRLCIPGRQAERYDVRQRRDGEGSPGARRATPAGAGQSFGHIGRRREPELAECEL